MLAGPVPQHWPSFKCSWHRFASSKVRAPGTETEGALSPCSHRGTGQWTLICSCDLASHGGSTRASSDSHLPSPVSYPPPTNLSPIRCLSLALWKLFSPENMGILNSLIVQIAFKRGVTWPVVRMLPGTRGSMTVMINDSQVRSRFGAMASSQHHPEQECGHTYPMQKKFLRIRRFCRDDMFKNFLYC